MRHTGALQRSYAALLRAVYQIELFSGFWYTQLTDTFQEANGLLTADRLPKFPIEHIRASTRGSVESHPHRLRVTSCGEG